jgi:hypothetical protein
MANNTLGVMEALLGGLWDAQHQNLRPLVSLWELMLRHCTPFSLVTWVFYLMVVSTYFVGGGFFAIFDLLNLFPQYRIQRKVLPSAELLSDCVRLSQRPLARLTGTASVRFSSITSSSSFR